VQGPDGKTSFQQEPCEPGAKGGPVILQDPSPAYSGPPKPSPAAPKVGNGQKAPQALKQLRAEEALREESHRNQQLESRNRELEQRTRAMECNAARRDLHVAQTPRAIYRLDSKGNKQYVEDANREAEIAAAQKRVTESCG